MSYHSDMMAEYYAIRESEEVAAEDQGYGYAEETREYWEHNPRTTFREFLIGRKGARDDREYA